MSYGSDVHLLKGGKPVGPKNCLAIAKCRCWICASFVASVSATGSSLFAIPNSSRQRRHSRQPRKAIVEPVFSNRPPRSKRFQTFLGCSVDVAREPALLSGIGA
jgi:hypothetical protein